MSFTYTTGIPAAGNNPSVDQPKMQTNTNSINSLIAVDHFTFSSGNAGAHNRVQLGEIATTIPAGLKGGGFETLYAKVAGSAPLGPLGEIFYHRAGALTGIQLTGPGTPTLNVNNGYTFLPGGIMIQWGLKQPAVAGDNVIAFTPVFSNQCLHVTVSVVSNTAGVIATNKQGSTSVAGFTAIVSPLIPVGTLADVSWIAIGY